MVGSSTPLPSPDLLAGPEEEEEDVAEEDDDSPLAIRYTPALCFNTSRAALLFSAALLTGPTIR